MLASERSAGKIKLWNGRNITIHPASPEQFQGVDLVFASAGGSISKKWRNSINAAGAVLIDNSSAFRMDPEVPLVVPEVNPEKALTHQGVIANPNCTTILLTVVLRPLSLLAPIKRVVVSTYQSASGAGAEAMKELKKSHSRCFGWQNKQK